MTPPIVERILLPAMTCLTDREVASPTGKTLFLFLYIICSLSACTHEGPDRGGTSASQNPPITAINVPTPSPPERTPPSEPDPSRKPINDSKDKAVQEIQKFTHEIVLLHNELAGVKGAVGEIGREIKLLTATSIGKDPDYQDFEASLGAIATHLTEISTSISELKSRCHDREASKDLNPTLKDILITLQDLPKKLPTPSPPTQQDKTCKPLEPKDWLTAGSLFIAALAFSIGTFRQLHYKRIDTMLEFQERFHDLVDRDAIPQSGLNKLFSSGGIDAERLNWLHWSLQHQQYSTWRRGLLPHNTYHFWMSRRVLDKGKHEKKMGIAEWDREQDYFLATHYHDFMKLLLAFSEIDGETEIKRVERAREHARNVMWKHCHPFTKLRFFGLKCLFPEGLLSRLGGS